MAVEEYCKSLPYYEMMVAQLIEDDDEMRRTFTCVTSHDERQKIKFIDIANVLIPDEGKLLKMDVRSVPCIKIYKH